MTNTFPIWTRRVAPEGRLAMPDNEHSLAEAFGAGLTKIGGWLGDYADRQHDKPETTGTDKDWNADQDKALDQGWSAGPDDTWNPNDLWPRGGWSWGDKGAEPHLELLAGQDVRRQQYAATGAIFDLVAAADQQQRKLAAEAPAGAPGFAEQSMADFDKLADQTMAGTSPAMRPYMEAQIAARRDQHLADATRLEVQARNAWDRQTAQDMLDKAVAQVSADPGRFDFAAANLGQAIKASNLSPAEQEMLLGKVKDDLGYAALTSLVERDPDRAAQMIESGTADKYMGADEKSAWLQKVADRQDRRRLDEVNAWRQADNAAPGAYLGLRDSAKQDLLQRLQRGTLSQDAIDRRNDMLGPELAADFTAMVARQAAATSDPATTGALVMAAGDRDLWREAADAMLQGRLSVADFGRIVETNRRLLQADAAGAAYRTVRKELIRRVLGVSGRSPADHDTMERALSLFDAWAGAHPEGSLLELADQAGRIAQVAQGEQPDQRPLHAGGQ